MKKLAYTVLQLSDLYSVAPSAIYTGIATGRIRALKKGRTYLIPEADAEIWFNSLPETAKRAPKKRGFWSYLFRKWKKARTQ